MGLPIAVLAISIAVVSGLLLLEQLRGWLDSLVDDDDA